MGPLEKLLAAGMLGLALAAPAAETVALDLPGAIRLALERNRELAIAATGVRSRALDIDVAGTEFQWSVKPDTQAGATGDGVEGRLGLAAAKKFETGTTIDARGGASHFPMFETSPWRSYVTVELRQPLLRRAGRATQREPIVAAEERLLAERRRWETQKADLVLEVVRTFERMILTSRQMEFDAALVRQLDRFHALTSAREKQGRATRVDLLRVDMQRSEAQSRVENNREEHFSLAQALAELIGAAPDTGYNLTPPPLPDIRLPEAAEAVRTALENRLDYAQALQDASAGRRHVELARRDLLPDLAIVTRGERYGDDRTFASSFDANDERWFAGLAADTDFNRSRQHLAARQAALTAEAATETVAVRARAITRDVQQAMSGYRRARTELTLAERNRKVAGDRATLARRLFTAGRGDHFSATDAEDAVVLAETRLLAARAGASIAGYALLRATGTLLETPPDLRPPASPPEVP